MAALSTLIESTDNLIPQNANFFNYTEVFIFLQIASTNR